jgi:hypothetical protein
MDYVYLRAWCRMMGSNGDYTKSQLERARKAGAPANAIYEHHDNEGPTGEWATFDPDNYGTMSRDTHHKIVDIANRIQGVGR